MTITAEYLFGKLSWCNANGPDDPGVTRPSYSAHETKAMLVIATEAKGCGLHTEWDDAGNLHVVHQGEGREVVTGSHLDSVPNGGPYDGTAGVVAGFLALQAMARANHRRQARLIVLRGEESAWFGKCYLGSTALLGGWTEDTLRLVSKEDGSTLATHVDRCPGAALNLCTRRRNLTILDDRQIAAFIEVHIEQGPVLHEADEPLAIVTTIRGNHRYPKCRIFGGAGHSGTTPMRGRRDAVMAFSELATSMEYIIAGYPGRAVLTFGSVATPHGSMTTIPDLVEFALEFRADTAADLEMLDNTLRLNIAGIAEKRGVTVELGERLVTEPVTLNTVVRSLLSHHASLVTRTPAVRKMPSGAGHDAAVFQKHGIPTGMIFIRNEHGSHNPRESMRMDDFALAVEVLTHTMMSPSL